MMMMMMMMMVTETEREPLINSNKFFSTCHAFENLTGLRTVLLAVANLPGTFQRKKIDVKTNKNLPLWAFSQTYFDAICALINSFLMPAPVFSESAIAHRAEEPLA